MQIVVVNQSMWIVRKSPNTLEAILSDLKRKIWIYHHDHDGIRYYRVQDTLYDKRSRYFSKKQFFDFLIEKFGVESWKILIEINKIINF